MGIEVSQAFYDVLARFKPIGVTNKAINVMTLDFTKELVRAYASSDVKVNFYLTHYLFYPTLFY